MILLKIAVVAAVFYELNLIIRNQRVIADNQVNMTKWLKQLLEKDKNSL